MLIKRIIVALLSLAILAPNIVIAAPYTHGTKEFRDLYFKYDAKRNVFLDSAGASDNICRLMQFEAYQNTGSYDHRCAQPLLVPALKLIMPQTVYGSATCAKTASAAGMRTGRKVSIPKPQLAYIADAAAEAMTSPTTFTRLGVAFDRCGRPTGVFSDDAVKCDALGWILKKSCDELALTKKNRHIAYRVSEILNKEVLRLTGRSIVALNDEEGRTAIVGALREVAKRLRGT